MIEIDMRIKAKITEKNEGRLTKYLNDNLLDLEEFVNSDAELIEFLDLNIEHDIDSEIEIRSVLILDE